MNILFAQLIGKHGQSDGLLLPICFEPGPDTIARSELLEPAPPASDLQLRIRNQRPHLGQLLSVDEKGYPMLGRSDRLQGREALGYGAEELRGAGDLFNLVGSLLGFRFRGR